MVFANTICIQHKYNTICIQYKYNTICIQYRYKKATIFWKGLILLVPENCAESRRQFHKNFDRSPQKTPFGGRVKPIMAHFSCPLPLGGNGELLSRWKSCIQCSWGSQWPQPGNQEVRCVLPTSSLSVMDSCFQALTGLVTSYLPTLWLTHTPPAREKTNKQTRTINQNKTTRQSPKISQSGQLCPGTLNAREDGLHVNQRYHFTPLLELSFTVFSSFC